jgi:peptidoglycan/LPS O-acetylase OafA/YrhL
MRSAISTTPNHRLPYMAGLDGLRAISVLAVLAYHANFPWAVGGFLGVESFFVISGYLITSLLLREHLATQRLALSRFWLRRARRLLPALCLVLVAVVPMAWQWAPDALPRLREDVPSALLYITNWVFVFREVPYFEQFGRPPLLQHLWSLAVEEQFYLFWPLALWVILRIIRGRNAKQTLWLVVSILVGVGASFALMLNLYDPLADPTRVYYGTDTRATGFLLGAALAAIWKPGKHAGQNKWMVEVAGFVGVLGLLSLFGSLHEYEPFLYRGGFMLTAFVTCLVVLAVSSPKTRLAKLLGCKPLRWIGTRSYGIYLWHWPVMVVSGWGTSSALPHAAIVALQISATFLLAELSYQWIEQPIRQRGVRAWWLDSTKLLGRLRLNAASVVGMVVLVGYVTVQPNSSVSAHASSEVPGSPKVTLPAQMPPTPVTPTRSPTSRAVMIKNPIEVVSDPLVKTLATRPTRTPEVSNQIKITFIGDSIMESVGRRFNQEFTPGNFYLDAVRKRRMEDALILIPELAEDGRLGETVVIHLGTNVPFKAVVFDSVVQSLLEHDVTRVLFLTVKRPVAWESIVNNQLAEGVSRWPQAELIDWHQLSKSHSGWFGADSVHPTSTGTAAYVKAIREALGDAFP